jgi:hypothetical protein
MTISYCIIKLMVQSLFRIRLSCLSVRRAMRRAKPDIKTDKAAHPGKKLSGEQNGTRSDGFWKYQLAAIHMAFPVLREKVMSEVTTKQSNK